MRSTHAGLSNIMRTWSSTPRSLNDISVAIKQADGEFLLVSRQEHITELIFIYFCTCAIFFKEKINLKFKRVVFMINKLLNKSEQELVVLKTNDNQVGSVFCAPLKLRHFF